MCKKFFCLRHLNLLRGDMVLMIPSYPDEEG